MTQGLIVSIKNSDDLFFNLFMEGFVCDVLKLKNAFYIIQFNH